MSPQARPFLVLAALAVAAALLASWVSAPRPGAGSVRSRDADGWLAARRYVEARDCDIELLDGAVESWPSEGVVVTTLPWSQDETGGSLSRLWARVSAGLTLVVSYAGQEIDPAEDALLKALGLDRVAARERPPLWPWSFERWASQEWELHLAGTSASPLRIRALDRVPTAPADARPLLVDSQGRPLAFDAPLGRGRVIVLPAEALSNGRLGAPGHADLLETLLASGDRWAFDEFHHGLRPAAAPASGLATRSFDGLLGHLAFLYGLTVLALVRRPGPAWREEVTRSGSASALLIGLGGLHRRLGHQSEAAARLLRRAAELSPGAALPSLPAGKVDLLALARQVAQARRR
jgi:hypothetical protein